jgi:alkylhydroperoxidase family enzyme
VFAALVERVLRGPAHTSVEQRAVCAGTTPAVGHGLPPAAEAVIEKIRRHAYKVTDEDVAALRAAGLDDDQIYDLTAATAVGVAQRRLAAAMAALQGVK